MSESVRRRRYRYDRVMIESGRILDPQLDDGVLFFTGAQIELMRNVTEYLRRLETYTSEYHLGYYLTPTAEDYDDLLAIVADLEETLMGNPNALWGYADRFSKQDVVESTGGTTDCFAPVVPEGYVYVLENYALYHGDVDPKGLELTIIVGAVTHMVFEAPNCPAGVWQYGGVNLTLKEGDTLRLRVFGLTATKSATLRVWGHTMIVPV